MNLTTKLPSESLGLIESSAYPFLNTSLTGTTSTDTATSRTGLFFVINQTAQQSNQSKDIDDFIGELLAQDQALEKDLRDGRKLVADILYKDEPDSLKVLRLRAGYSQQELADKIGMRQPHICEFEAGKRKPSADTLKKLSDALNVTADVILKSIY